MNNYTYLFFLCCLLCGTTALAQTDLPIQKRLKVEAVKKENPIGIVKRRAGNKTFEIIWINEGIATRFALVDMAKSHRLEVISEADR